MRTLDAVISDITDKFMDEYLSDNMDIPTIVASLYQYTIEGIEFENTARDKNYKIKSPLSLYPSQIATIIHKMYDVILLNFIGEDTEDKYDLLAIYVDDKNDKNYGLYTVSETRFQQIAHRIDFNLTEKAFKEILFQLRLRCKKKVRTLNKDLIAVNNGIFNYKTKELMPFSPEYIFISKSAVNYVNNPNNPHIKNPDGTIWDVETWVTELSDDPEIVNSIWEVLSAIIRPHVIWDKACFLYSTVGNNGKGTLCQLMRNLTGKPVSIPIATFSDRFGLEQLIQASAIIVDENDVGTFIDKSAKLKAVITNDIVDIDRKNEKIISFRYYGFMVQCLNELPQVKDRSDSWYRRQLFLPMDKNFGEIKKPYIKSDYLCRKEVLEYVQYKLLNTNFYELSTPEASNVLLNEYKAYNDPVRDFFEEISEQFVWDTVPFTFIYDIYKVWFTKTSPSGKVINYRSFIQNLKSVIRTNTEWIAPDNAFRINAEHDKPEPLITKYNLEDWKTDYSGLNKDLINKAYFSSTKYRGIRRL